MYISNRYISLLTGSLLMLCSCNDYLDLEPLDEVTPDKFLWTEADLASYAIKQYSFSTHDGWGIGTWGNDNHTDNQASSSYSNRWVPGQWRVSESLKPSDDPWNFEKIRNANYFIETVIPRFQENKLTGNYANISHYIGEVYFARAWQYFDKLQTLGDFPIVKNTLPDDLDILTEASRRKPRHEVARFIISDLDSAILLMNNKPEGGRNRLTKNAALLVKSRVALFEASWLNYHRNTARVPGGPEWPGGSCDIDIDQEIRYFLTECKQASEELADNVELAENNGGKMDNPYFAQFSAVNLETYPEILFWRSYNLNDFKISHSATFYIRVGGNTGFTRQFVETFLCEDGKPAYASDLYAGDNSLMDVRENRESRLKLFMMQPGEVLSNDNPAVKDTLQVAPAILDKQETRAVTGYQLRKGLSHTWYRDGSTSIEGSPVFRAAEAYLNYIEASCIENGGNAIDGKAATYWNKIRNRVNLPDYQITVAATDLSKESDWGVYSGGQPVTPLLYSIRRERRCEMMEEGLRMMDLKRWRALDQVKNYQVEGFNLWESDLKDLYVDSKGNPALIQEGTSDNPNVSSEKNSKYLRPYQIIKNGNFAYEGYNWCDAHYLSPISLKHFRITATNPNDPSTSVIYQNPGWPTVANEGAIGY